MNIIGRRKIFYFISGTVILASILAVIVFRFRFGIDFIGGTFWELQFLEEPGGGNEFSQELHNIFSKHQISGVIIQGGEVGTFQLRFQEIDEPTHQKLLAEIKSRRQVIERRFETVGPTIGRTLRQKAIQAILAVLFGISIYIAWAFRGVSRPVPGRGSPRPGAGQPIPSWKYGIVTVFTLFHDVAVPIGLFSILGKFAGVEIDSNFIVSLLVVMGFSVHDTIVVFDRIRENLRKHASEPFDNVVNRSVNETFGRSINTSLTTLLALAALLLLGSSNLQPFVLAMMVGIFVGTYSSIFIASPILVDWHNWGKSGLNR